MLVILIIVIISCIIFILLHLRPLTDDEINYLSVKRRNKNIRGYYSFDAQEYNANKDFKKRMNPNGTFYKINESLFSFPSLAAALLKYKKHEWIIIAFEKNKNINLAWMNKGIDRANVNIQLPFYKISEIAMKDDDNSVMAFHNHPNSNPNSYICNRPSNQDIQSAIMLAKILNANKINLVEFVCERGKHYEYYLSTSNYFMPIEEYMSDIRKINGTSKTQNLNLHIERIF